jgi:hypothetical protein
LLYDGKSFLNEIKGEEIVAEKKNNVDFFVFGADDGAFPTHLWRSNRDFVYDFFV